MKIKHIEPIAVSFPMKKPVFMAGVEIRQADNVLVRVEATPINPSDLGLLLGPADLSTAKTSGGPVLTASVPGWKWLTTDCTSLFDPLPASVAASA